MKQDGTDCVDLDSACKVLVDVPSVQALLKTEVGPRTCKKAMALMRDGKLEGQLGAEIHDLLADTIHNEAEVVWSGIIRQPHDEYAIQVKAYKGVFWVWAMEYDPVGYFLDEDRAISYARATWDVSEGDDASDDEDSQEDGEVRCPYCDSTDNCDHLLLFVDKTFRHAEGGLLYEAFNSRWSDVMAEQEENTADNDEDDENDEEGPDERELFEELLDQVSSLADAELSSSPDSAPGMSSNYGYYFCSSKKKAEAALIKYSINP
jgi:hypothetical protein